MSKLEKQDILPEFKNASRLYSDASIFMHQVIARKAGLTGADHKYLGIILRHKQLSAGELSKLTGLTTGAVTGLIDRLEKKKLIKRQFTKEDRRKVMIVPIQENCMNLLEPLFSELQLKTAEFIDSFSLEEILTIQRYHEGATAVMQAVTQNLNIQQND